MPSWKGRINLHGDLIRGGILAGNYVLGVIIDISWRERRRGNCSKISPRRWPTEIRSTYVIWYDMLLLLPHSYNLREMYILSPADLIFSRPFCIGNSKIYWERIRRKCQTSNHICASIVVFMNCWQVERTLGYSAVVLQRRYHRLNLRIHRAPRRLQ